MAKVEINILRLLPIGRIIGEKEHEDMDGKIVPCIVLRWYSDGVKRYSFFSSEDGSYCGDMVE